MGECIFCKITQGEIPASKVYEDQDFIAFHDIHPAAPVHFLLIPKQHIASLYEVGEMDQLLLGKIQGTFIDRPACDGPHDAFRFDFTKRLDIVYIGARYCTG